MTLLEDRCRLVLIVPDADDDAVLSEKLAHALRGGDVASVILPQYGLDEVSFQKRAEGLVAIVQEAGAAALVAGDSRVAGRAKADGLHILGKVEELAEAIEKFTPKMIVGAGGASDRHTALEVGEARPDYIFFGKLDGDIKPEAHPKNLALGEWWASMVEIPCIVMGGTDIASVLQVAETGAEFVALRSAVFDHPAGTAAAISEINALLDEKAPRFDA
ncbi:thiamine-phosphate pyrophosphorylase [Neorhizobium galegae]|uniref:thiamine phosphate synthase n=1 Tax=Neorhizobium galegae TaxID=399 RepID=UPI001AE3AAB3|nr:thiamine phosphate synthase [Neorhizobium galegae]MBP2550092.1 thiamine-phosphate pyrophosphorylase [Neorhizobium galegae]